VKRAREEVGKIEAAAEQRAGADRRDAGRSAVEVFCH
jgi:hypothetical protein